MNELFETDAFSELSEELDGREVIWMKKMKAQLRESLLVGKPLRCEWFREKKFGNKRLFYVINQETSKVLLVSFATKKRQQETIEHVLKNKAEYLNLLR